MRFDFDFENGMPELDVKTPRLGIMRSIGSPLAKVSRRHQWPTIASVSSRYVLKFFESPFAVPFQSPSKAPRFSL